MLITKPKITSFSTFIIFTNGIRLTLVPPQCDLIARAIRLLTWLLRVSKTAVWKTSAIQVCLVWRIWWTFIACLMTVEGRLFFWMGLKVHKVLFAVDASDVKLWIGNGWSCHVVFVIVDIVKRSQLLAFLETCAWYSFMYPRLMFWRVAIFFILLRIIIIWLTLLFIVVRSFDIWCGFAQIEHWSFLAH